MWLRIFRSRFFSVADFLFTNFVQFFTYDFFYDSLLVCIHLLRSHLVYFLLLCGADFFFPFISLMTSHLRMHTLVIVGYVVVDTVRQISKYLDKMHTRILRVHYTDVANFVCVCTHTTNNRIHVKTYEFQLRIIWRHLRKLLMAGLAILLYTYTTINYLHLNRTKNSEIRVISMANKFEIVFFLTVQFNFVFVSCSILVEKTKMT